MVSATCSGADDATGTAAGAATGKAAASITAVAEHQMRVSNVTVTIADPIGRDRHLPHRRIGIAPLALLAFFGDARIGPPPGHAALDQRDGHRPIARIGERVAHRRPPAVLAELDSRFSTVGWTFTSNADPGAERQFRDPMRGMADRTSRR
jgi:hypothetical protein